jgi:hypothetical protein
MSNILFFSRNKSTGVEHVDRTLVKAWCRLQDTLTDALVEIAVRLPDLELTDIRVEINRSHKTIAADATESLRKARGVRIGPGVVKILKGLVGDRNDLKELLSMVDECCQGVILSFTKDELGKAPEDEREAKRFYEKLLRENVRLYNSCIAFAPDSPLVEGFDPKNR